MQYPNFQPKQLAAWEALKSDKVKYLLFGGAAAGGKSYFLRWSAILLGYYYYKRYGIKGATIGLFCEDYPTLKDRQITKIKYEVPPEVGRLLESRDEGYLFEGTNGIFKILLRNLDDPAKYASVEFAAVFVDELTKNPVETFEDLRFRLRYPGIPFPKFVAATNPGSIGHEWVKSKWITPDPEEPDKEQSLFKYIPAKVSDNIHVDKSYIAQLEALPEKKRKAYLEGSWEIFAGQVFSEWRNSLHVVKPFEIPKEWNIYGCLDLGWNKPFAALWCAQSPDNRTFVFKELYGNSDWFEAKFGAPMTAKRLAKILNAVSAKMGHTPIYWVGDPAIWNKILRTGEITIKKQDVEGESYAEVMINAGLNLIAGDNHRMNGLNRFRESLSIAPDGKPYLQVFENCYNTIKTIPSLVYNDKTKIEDVDTDGPDHIYDALRYYLMSRPSPIYAQKERPTTLIQAAKQRAAQGISTGDEDFI